jgi:hypothetical protein
MQAADQGRPSCPAVDTANTSAHHFSGTWHNRCSASVNHGYFGEKGAVFGHSHTGIRQYGLRGTGMRQATTRELYDYWNALRGRRTAPERAEIDPAAIRNVLADTFMLDVDIKRHFPFRLSGSRLNALFCDEQKGHSFLEHWPVGEAYNLGAVLMTVADAACPMIATASAAPKGYGEHELELLFLPLRHAGETKGRILGSMTLFRKPPWLGLLPVEELTLRSLGTVNDPAPPKAALIPSLFRSPPPAPHPRSDFETRGHLRVFRGGR